MAYIIKGQAGKRLDETERTLAQLKAEIATLEFASFAEDSLMLDFAADDATGAGIIIPELGQIISLWDGDRRLFEGTVVAPRIGTRRISVKAVGPWWWMTRINVRQQVPDGDGISADRPQFGFSQGMLNTQITLLIDAAITTGVPIQAGIIDDMFPVPGSVLNDMTFARALTELLAYCADAVPWFDYSAAGLPRLMVTRRINMLEKRYTAEMAVEEADIEPRLDLEVRKVALHYVTRSPQNGRPQWAVQSAGTAAPGYELDAAFSGDEISDFLPPDDFDSYVLRTVPVGDITFNLCKILDTNLAIQHPNATAFATGKVFDNAPSAPSGGGFSGGISYQELYAEPPKLTTQGSRDGWYVLISDEPPPPWVRDTMLSKPCTMEGSLSFMFQIPLIGHVPSEEEMAIRNSAYASCWKIGPGGFTAVFLVKVSVSATLVNRSYPTQVTLFKPWEYDYRFPPAGMADGMLSASNWVPWEGVIGLVADRLSGANLLNRKFNLEGFFTDCETMDATARRIRYDFGSGRYTVSLGAPGRFDFATLAQRLRKPPGNNIQFLTTDTRPPSAKDASGLFDNAGMAVMLPAGGALL